MANTGSIGLRGVIHVYTRRTNVVTGVESNRITWRWKYFSVIVILTIPRWCWCPNLWKIYRYYFSLKVVLARDHLTYLFIASLLPEKFKCSSLFPREGRDKEKFLFHLDIYPNIAPNMNTFLRQNVRYKDAIIIVSFFSSMP